MILENFDYSELINLFKAAPILSKKVDVEKIQKLALKKGYLVHPDCCNEHVYTFLLHQIDGVDMNSTFYKTWEDVISKTRFEIFLDQIVSYTASYVLGESWVPNEGSEQVDFTTYTVIRPISFDELYEKCLGMLQSGIALKFNTMNTLCEYVKDYYLSHDGATLDIDSIKSREAQTYLCSELDMTPNDKFNLLRYIVFKTTGETMVIKNKEMLIKIQSSLRPFDFTTLSENQLNTLASIFYRYKDIFLAFRKHKTMYSWSPQDKLAIIRVAENRKVINKIRRLAPKYHTPFKIGFWESLLHNYNTTTAEIKKNAETVDSFRLIRLIQTINTHLQEPDKKLYIIRNGKTFIKDTLNEDVDTIHMINLKNVLTDILVDRLKSKACIVKYPKDFVLTCPTSEKNFVGDIPFGSYYNMGKDNYFGIYWRDEWGTYDFDLSFIDERGCKIGWNSGWSNKDVIYSGDVTRAPQGASEIILINRNCPNGIININRYSGNPNSQYQFFFGKTTGLLQTPKNGYMVNPDTIKVRTMNKSESPQESIGAVINNRAYLFKLGVAGGRVANISRLGTSFLELIKIQAKSFVKLKDLLDKADFINYDDVNWNLYKEEDFKILDLTNLNRDTLITLFS